MAKGHLCKLSLLLALYSALAFNAANAVVTPGAGKANAPQVVPGRILVNLGQGANADGLASDYGLNKAKSVANGRLLILEGAAIGNEHAVAALVAKDARVNFAEPDFVRQVHQGPSDTGYGLKWDLHNDGTLGGTNGADMDWQEAYTLLGSGFLGSPVIVAVIDTGIDATHSDLYSKAIAGEDFFDSPDLDGPKDTYGHGTHVAGTALATANNSGETVGVGFSPNIEVMPLRVGDHTGIPTSAVVAAIHHARGNGAKVINMSLGGGVGSSSEELAINEAWNAGLVIVASSGNDGRNRVSYPAAYTNCIAVGSTNWNDQQASYSNGGSGLDVVAPGGQMSRPHDEAGIYSTMPTYPVYLNSEYGYYQEYDQLQGTSMAAPQVAGLAALLFSIDSSLSNVEVRGIIESTADDLGRSGWDRDFGWGRINVHQAVLAVLGGPANKPPVADFTYSASGLTLTFTNSSYDDEDGVIKSCSWDFGDGSTSTAENPIHSYSAAGTYSVTLVVEDSKGATDSQTQSITVGSSGGGTMYVSNISFSMAGRHLKMSISVSSASAPVAGAVVDATLTLGSSPILSLSGTADSSGQVSFVHKFAASGTYVLTVDDLTHSGYTYDPSSNVETSDTYTVK